MEIKKASKLPGKTPGTLDQWQVQDLIPAIIRPMWKTDDKKLLSWRCLLSFEETNVTGLFAFFISLSLFLCLSAAPSRQDFGAGIQSPTLNSCSPPPQMQKNWLSIVSKSNLSFVGFLNWCPAFPPHTAHTAAKSKKKNMIKHNRNATKHKSS